MLPHWLKHYQSSDLRPDIVAGLTVGVIMIPQAMAYAMLAGLPPVYGLYACVFPLVIYAFLGSSKHLSVGPVAIDSIMVVTGISIFAIPASEEYISLALLLAFMVGFIQLSLGLSRLGFLINFLSKPVIQGFISAAAILIALSQLRHLLRLPMATNRYFEDLLLYLSHASSIHIPTLLIGLSAILLLILIKKLIPAFPGPLVVVILSTLVVYLFDLHTYGVDIIGVIPSGLPTPVFPNLDIRVIEKLLPTAFAIALISFMESNVVAKAIQARHKTYSIIPNRELLALGVANMIGSVFRAFPVSGGFSRSAVNDQAGARTQMSSIITAALIVITLLFITPLFYYLPTVALASVILVIIFRLVNLQEVKHLWNVDRKDLLMMLVTFFGTLFLGIGTGIGIGVLLSLAWILYEASYPHYAELGRVPGTHSFRNIKRFPELDIEDSILIFRFDAPLFFANIHRFRQVLLDRKSQRKEKIKAVVIDMQSINMVDSTALSVLADIVEEMKKQGVSLLFTEIKGPVRDKFHKSGLIERVGAESFFITIEDAVDYACGRDREFARDIVLQRNK